MDGWKSQLLCVRRLFISGRAHIWPPISGSGFARAPLFPFQWRKKVHTHSQREEEREENWWLLKCHFELFRNARRTVNFLWNCEIELTPPLSARSKCKIVLLFYFISHSLRRMLHKTFLKLMGVARRRVWRARRRAAERRYGISISTKQGPNRVQRVNLRFTCSRLIKRKHYYYWLVMDRNTPETQKPCAGRARLNKSWTTN